jgi:hypothetical protein
MSNTIDMQTLDGEKIAFIDEIRGQGTYKDCYFLDNNQDVILWFRDNIDDTQEQRLKQISKLYRDSILQGAGGAYWQKLICLPRALVRYQQRLGLIVPRYPPQFLFQYGSQNEENLPLKGKEKESYWFISLKHRAQTLDPRELGEGRHYLRMALLSARIVRRLHKAGLAHGDISYKNVLADPTTGQVCFIDLDGLIVPDRHPPQVVGTPGFMAPEVVKSQGLPKEQRILPSQGTDNHALAVLIYQYLLLRHPLQGDGFLSENEAEQQAWMLGEKAHFIEHPDGANAINTAWLEPYEQLWKNPTRLPYTAWGAWLKPLFERAFIDGLHQPALRPTAEEWEEALVATADWLQPCQNAACPSKWYVWNAQKTCPFCGQVHAAATPVLHFYSAREPRQYTPEHKLLAGYQHAGLYAWHGDRYLQPNEKLLDSDKKRWGYFVWHDGAWFLVSENAGIQQIKSSLDDRHTLTAGSSLKLENGQKLLFPSGRLAVVQLL